jgi:hypothetical protein
VGCAREEELGCFPQRPRRVSSSRLVIIRQFFFSYLSVLDSCDASVPPTHESQFTRRRLYSIVDIYDALSERNIGLFSVLQDPIFIIGGPAALGACSAADVLDKLEETASSWSLTGMLETLRLTRTQMEEWREEERRRMESEGFDLSVDPLEGIPKVEPVRKQVSVPIPLFYQHRFGFNPSSIGEAVSWQGQASVGCSRGRRTFAEARGPFPTVNPD